MQELTRTEERIMLVVWKLKTAFVKDIQAHMPNDPKPPYNTISSVVRILVRKGFLEYKAYGRTHEYSPRVSKSKYRRYKLRKLLGRYYGSSPSDLVADLLRDEKIGKGELKKIKALAKNPPENPPKKPGNRSPGANWEPFS